MFVFPFLDMQRAALIEKTYRLLGGGGEDGLIANWAALCREVRLYLDQVENNVLARPAPNPLLEFKLVYARKLHDDVEDLLANDPVDDREKTRNQLTELLDLLRSIEAYDRHVIYPLAKTSVHVAGPHVDGRNRPDRGIHPVMDI